VEVHPCLYISSVSGDFVLCYFSKEGSSTSDFPEALLGVFPSKPSYVHAQESQLLASSLLRLPLKVS